MATALVVIDVQQGMFAQPSPPHLGGAMLANIRTLQDRARASKVPVLHVQHDGGAGDPLARGSPGFAIERSVVPVIGEDVFVKDRCDAFLGTDLDARLRALGIGRLVIAGMQTEYCIDTTTRAAFARGYQVAVAGDGHSTFDSTPFSAADIIAHHNRVLREFASVVPAAEICF